MYKKIFRHESVPALVEILNGDDDWLKSLGVSHLDYFGLCTETTKKLSIFIIVASSFVKNPNKPAPLHVTTL